MKVLMTGFTSRQTGGKARLDPVNQVNGLKNIIEALGHDVDIVRVGLDFDASAYDVILFGVCGLDTISAQYAIGALELMSRHDNIIIYADDVRNKTLQRTCRRWLEKGIINPNIVNRDKLNNDTIKERFSRGVAKLANQIEAPFLVSCTDNGDVSRLGINARDFIRYDIHHFVELDHNVSSSLIDFGDIVEKKRAWVFGSLTSEKSFLDKMQPNLSWELLHYGSNDMGLGKIHESQMIEVMRENWGILHPIRASKGTGWWRKGWWHAQETGAVISCHEDDATLYGEPFERVSHKRVKAVENLTDSQLEALSAEQGEAFWQTVIPKEETMRRIEQALLSVAEK